MGDGNLRERDTDGWRGKIQQQRVVDILRGDSSTGDSWSCATWTGGSQTTVGLVAAGVRSAGYEGGFMTS